MLNRSGASLLNQDKLSRINSLSSQITDLYKRLEEFEPYTGIYYPAYGGVSQEKTSECKVEIDIQLTPAENRWDRMWGWARGLINIGQTTQCITLRETGKTEVVELIIKQIRDQITELEEELNQLCPCKEDKR